MKELKGELRRVRKPKNDLEVADGGHDDGAEHRSEIDKQDVGDTNSQDGALATINTINQFQIGWLFRTVLIPMGRKYPPCRVREYMTRVLAPKPSNYIMSLQRHGGDCIRDLSDSLMCRVANRGKSICRNGERRWGDIVQSICGRGRQSHADERG